MVMYWGAIWAKELPTCTDIFRERRAEVIHYLIGVSP